MRQWLVVIVCAVGCVGNVSNGAAPRATTRPSSRASTGPSMAPMVAIQKEDYAVVRGRFHTKMVSGAGVLPAGWFSREPVGAPPAGAEEAEYSSGGMRLKGWISAAARDGSAGDGAAGGAVKKKPAVLFLHGGFYLAADAWEVTRPYREAGFVVFTPALRSENGQPGTFTMFYDEVDDVLAAGKFLRERPEVDPDRVFIAGHSSGGILTMLAVEASKDFRAAAPMSGSPDQLMLSKVMKMTVPFDANDPREFEVRSPLAYVGSLACPMRIYYGSEEIIFDQASRRMAELAKARGLDVEAQAVPGNHKSSVPEAVKRSVAFFQGKL